MKRSIFIEFYDEENSKDEDRYNTIEDTSAEIIAENRKSENTIIGSPNQSIGKVNDILFVVYTERIKTESYGKKVDITRLISAKMTTNFEIN